LAFIGALALGFLLFQSGTLTVGAIFLVVRYTQMLQQPMQQLTRQLQEMQRASAGIVRIRELLKLRPQVLDGEAGLHHDGALTVQFENVSFEYDDAGAARNGDSASGAVLHDLSFTLPAGTVLGLLGRTGSGKTTITRLLARLYDPTSGAIRLDGKDIRAVRLAALRCTLAMVTLDVQPFPASPGGT